MFKPALLLIALLSFWNPTICATPSGKVVIAYLFPQDRVLQPHEVAASQLTRINYAFANLKSGRVVEGFSQDSQNLRTLNSLKTRNPQLKILISIGGWSWSGGFSDAALTVESRNRFASSAIAFLRRHELDGIDIDWEYPGLEGSGNRHRPEDKQNYTALLAELRKQLDEEGHRVHRHLLLTIAAGASDEFITHTQLAAVHRLVDSVNLMSYDYYVPSSDHTTGHHAPLHVSPADPKQVAGEKSVEHFEAAGVPSQKIVLGVPFYGHAWSHVAAINNGLFQKGKKSNLEPDYKTVCELLSQGGYKRFWDPVANAPYLYNAADRNFITYEDPQSLRSKMKFVLSRHLQGVMFWEYSNDPGDSLLHAINQGLGGARRAR